MNVTRLTGMSLVALATALLAWVLYDASSIVAFFGLGAAASEASVAMVALGIVTADTTIGVALLRTSRRQQRSP